MPFKNHLNTGWNILIEITIACASYITGISLCIVTVPFFVYRICVTFGVKLYDKDVTKIITGLSAMFHRDFDLYDVKSLSSIVTCLKMTGSRMTRSEFEQTCLNRLGLVQGNSNILFPELKQKFIRVFGYTFLKWDRNFDITNHISVYHKPNCATLNHQDILMIWEELMVKPYAKNRSPWEIVIIENRIDFQEDLESRSPDWICFLRTHHSIADGFGVQKIISTLFETDYEPNFVTKSTPLQKLLLNLRSLILGPYDLANRLVKKNSTFNSLHIPFHEHSKQYFIVESHLIPVKTIKFIKKHFGVSYTTILIEIISGGLRKYLIKNNHSIPELLTVGIPFPSLKRGETLGNDFMVAPVDLPLNTALLTDRLKNIQTQLQKLTFSSFTRMLSLLISLIGNYPSLMLRAVTRKSTISVSYSTVPGPEVRVGLGDRELVEANFTHGMASDSLGLCFSTITFNGYFRMTLFVEQNLVESRENARDIINCIMEEFRELNAELKLKSN